MPVPAAQPNLFPFHWFEETAALEAFERRRILQVLR